MSSRFGVRDLQEGECNFRRFRVMVSGPLGSVRVYVLDPINNVNFRSIHLAAQLTMGHGTDFKVYAGPKYVGPDFDWSNLDKHSMIRIEPRLLGGAPRKLILTPILGHYVICLRALLTCSGDPLIIMGLAELYVTASSHTELLEKVQHHLICSVTTLTELWHALAVYSVSGELVVLKNLTTVMKGLLSD